MHRFFLSFSLPFFLPYRSHQVQHSNPAKRALARLAHTPTHGTESQRSTHSVAPILLVSQHAPIQPNQSSSRPAEASRCFCFVLPAHVHAMETAAPAMNCHYRYIILFTLTMIFQFVRVIRTVLTSSTHTRDTPFPSPPHTTNFHPKVLPVGILNLQRRGR